MYRSPIFLKHLHEKMNYRYLGLLIQITNTKKMEDLRFIFKNSFYFLEQNSKKHVL